MAETYLSDKQLAQRYGVHRSTPWRWIKSDEAFPKPIALSSGCTRWLLSDLLVWEVNKLKNTTASNGTLIKNGGENAA